MTDEVHPLRAADIDQREYIADKFVVAVVPPAFRSGTGGVAALQRGQTAKPRRGQSVDDRPVHGVAFGEAMQEDDDRPVGRPRVGHVEHEVTAAELFHRLTVSR